MINSIRFDSHVTPYTFEFNTTKTPLSSFTTTVEIPGSETNRPADHGYYPERQWLGKRLFSLEGDLLGLNAGDLMTMRNDMMRALATKAHRGYRTTGTLRMLLDGYPEEITALAMPDGWPEVSLNSLTGSRSRFMVNLKSPDPRLYGASQNLFTSTTTNTWVTPPVLGNADTWPVVTLFGPVSSGINFGVRYSASDSNGFNFDFGFFSLPTSTDWLRIDLLNRTVVDKNGADRRNQLQFDSVFAPLDPGCQVRYAGAGFSAGVSKMEVRWYNAYMI